MKEELKENILVVISKDEKKFDKKEEINEEELMKNLLGFQSFETTKVFNFKYN